MGLSEFCQHIERLNPELLEQQFGRLVAGDAEYSRRVREGAAQLRARLKVQETTLSAAFLQQTPACGGVTSPAPMR